MSERISNASAPAAIVRADGRMPAWMRIPTRTLAPSPRAGPGLVDRLTPPPPGNPKKPLRKEGAGPTHAISRPIILGLFGKILALGILDRNFSFAVKFLGWPWRRVFELAGVARGVAVEARWAALQPRGRLGTHCRHVAGLGLINFSACDAGAGGIL